MSTEPTGPAAGIRVSTAGGVRTIAFARPERRNAVDLDAVTAYHEALADADWSPEVRAVVVTGDGGTFCSGADPSLLAALQDPATQRRLAGGGATDPAFPLGLRVPVVAAMNGGAAGIGLVFALQADVRFLAEDARLSTSFARLGLVAEAGAAWLLPRLVGVGAALDLLLSARTVDAPEALRMGLVQRVLPRADVLPAAIAYASTLATSCSPRSLAVIKRQVHDGLTQTAGEAMADSALLLQEALRSADFAEAGRARQERRTPRFPDPGGSGPG